MNSLRVWTMVAVAAVIAVLIGGWFVGVQPMLAAAATSDGAATAADAQNQSLQLKLASLSREAAKLPAMRAQDAVLLKSVPSILKDNTFNRRVREVAALQGVTLTGVQIGDAAAYLAPTAVAGAKTLVVATTSPLVTSSNFASIPVTITASGDPESLLGFTTAIQKDERVTLINGVVVSTDDSGATTATFNGFIYSLKR